MDTQAPNWNPNTVIASIYEAALKPSLWPSILKQIDYVLEDYQISLLFMEDNLQNRNFAINSEGAYNKITYTFGQSYSANNFHNDFSYASTGDLIFLDAETSPLPNKLTEQNGFSLSASCASRSLKLLIPLLQGDSIGAALIIESNCMQELSPDCLAIIRQLSPHFVRALHIHNHLSTLKHRNDSTLEALQRTNTSVFILNTDLQVIFISREAEQLLTRQSALRIDTKKTNTVIFHGRAKCTFSLTQ